MDAVRGVSRVVRQLLLLALVGAVAVAIVPAVLAISSMDGAQNDAAEWGATSRHSLERMREHWPAADAAARQAAAPARTGAVDREALRELIAGTLAPDSARVTPALLATLDADTTAWARHGALVVPPHSRRFVALGMRASHPLRIDSAYAARLAADTLTPWLAVWRRAAATAEPPATWQYRVGAPGLDGTLALPTLGVARFEALAWINAATALLVLERGLPGDDSLAVRRARENVAMWHLLARSPNLAEHLAGYAGLRDAGAFLEYAGGLAGDSVAVADGDRLGDAADELRPHGLPAVGPRSPDADEAVQLALALAGDRRLPAAVRAVAVHELMVASCLAPSDIVLGTAFTMRGPMRDVSARLADVDPEGRLRPAIERSDAGWEAFTRGGGWRRTRQHPPTWTGMLEAAGLGGLAGRVMACAER